MSFFRLLILGGLISLLHFGPQWMSKQAAPEPVASPAAPMSVVPLGSAQQNKDFQKLLDNVQQQTGELTPADVEFLKNLDQASKSPAYQAPVLENLTRGLQEKNQHVTQTRRQVSDGWSTGRQYLMDPGENLHPWLWGVPGVVLIVAWLSFLLTQTAAARSLAQVGCGLARKWLWLLSLVIIAYALTTKSNPWSVLSNDWIMPPVIWLVGSALLLRVVDMNYPVWNTLIGGITAPLISMGLITVGASVAIPKKTL